MDIEAADQERKGQVKEGSWGLSRTLREEGSQRDLVSGDFREEEHSDLVLRADSLRTDTWPVDLLVSIIFSKKIIKPFPYFSSPKLTKESMTSLSLEYFKGKEA